VPQHPVNFCWHMANRQQEARVGARLKHQEARGCSTGLLGQGRRDGGEIPAERWRTRLRCARRMMGRHQPASIYASMKGYGETGGQTPRSRAYDFDCRIVPARACEERTYEGGLRPSRGPGRDDFMAGMNLFDAIAMPLLIVSAPAGRRESRPRCTPRACGRTSMMGSRARCSMPMWRRARAHQAAQRARTNQYRTSEGDGPVTQ